MQAGENAATSNAGGQEARMNSESEAAGIGRFAFFFAIIRQA